MTHYHSHISYQNAYLTQCFITSKYLDIFSNRLIFIVISRVFEVLIVIWILTFGISIIIFNQHTKCATLVGNRLFTFLHFISNCKEVTEIKVQTYRHAINDEHTRQSALKFITKSKNIHQKKHRKSEKKHVRVH